ncbi:MAG: trypsin-like serine protease [Elusimicrobia bacterium]|nr:trypsin-like serine protease [Elusimicrobiota bacterium]
MTVIRILLTCLVLFLGSNVIAGDMLYKSNAQMLSSPPFTPLEKAADKAGGGKNIDADGGLMSPLAETVRENSLTGFTGLDFAETDAKIVGNPKEVSPGEYEGVVFLQFLNYTEDGKSKLCTGTLISPRIVLTAGHCLYNLSSAYSKKDYTKYPEEIVTWAGVAIGYNLDPNDPRSGRIIANGAVAAKWHPQWQGGAPSNAVDMGLILLPPDAADGIQSYGLNRSTPVAGKKGIVAGYGRTGKRDIVKNMGITQLRRVTDRIVGIGGESSICSGDSGGPLFVEMDGQLKVAGVASRTTFDCNPRSGSATRVDSKLPWIDSVSEEWERIPSPHPIVTRIQIRKTEELINRFKEEFESLSGEISPAEYDPVVLP